MSQYCAEGELLALFPLKSWEIAEEIAIESGCEVSSYNSPSQIVLGGTIAAIEKAMKISKSKGVRKVVKLPVSTAFHTSIMKPAAEKFSEALERADILSQGEQSKFEVISTVSGEKLPQDKTKIRSLLIKQLDSPVRFRQAIQTSVDNSSGPLEFAALGPGKSLKTLISDNLGMLRNEAKISVVDKPSDTEFDG
jgi:[acyl-carrier-protein] S-malonyltransferase